MPIDTLELLKLFEEKIMGPSVANHEVRYWQEFRGSQNSYFDDPADQDNRGVRSLSQLLGEQDNLLMSLARQWEDAGMAVPAEIVREIEAFLADPPAGFDEDKQIMPRLLDYQYPVV